MLNTDWSNMGPLPLGEFAEFYAQTELLSYGLDVYPSRVDDHAVDFIIKDKSGRFKEIQVKSVYKGKYAYVSKDKMHISKDNPVIKNDYYWFFIHFVDGEMPKTYIIPGTDWEKAKEDGVLLIDRDYNGKKSAPEYGLSITQKSMQKLQKYEVTPALIRKYFED